MNPIEVQREPFPDRPEFFEREVAELPVHLIDAGRSNGPSPERFRRNPKVRGSQDTNRTEEGDAGCNMLEYHH